jgi:hypothetical protein
VHETPAAAKGTHRPTWRPLQTARAGVCCAETCSAAAGTRDVGRVGSQEEGPPLRLARHVRRHVCRPAERAVRTWWATPPLAFAFAFAWLWLNEWGLPSGPDHQPILDASSATATSIRGSAYIHTYTRRDRVCISTVVYCEL